MVKVYRLSWLCLLPEHTIPFPECWQSANVTAIPKGALSLDRENNHPILSPGCSDALLTISHHHQKSSDIGMESYIFQLDFIAAFDKVSHSGLLFKLKSIGVDDSMPSMY